MFLFIPKISPSVISLSCFLSLVEGQTILISRTKLAPDYSLRDVDGDNIPGQAGVDYPVYNSVPKDTSFRCKDYEYAGYFGDVEADCQAYHVCFPDGRNASFLCVNGTVFHQRYFVCDWWFHFDCKNAPELFNLNLFRKIPLPVLPPVQRIPYVKPIPEPGIARHPNNPPPVSNHRGNPDRNKNPDGRNERRTNPDGRNDPRKRNPYEVTPKNPQDRNDPKRRGGDCQCPCEDGKSQLSKYSKFNNR